MNLKSKMSCPCCLKILKKPILLPCGDNLCEAHLIEATIASNSKIKCYKCKEEFIINGHEFLLNNLLQDIIEDYNYLSPSEQKFKLRIADNLYVLKYYTLKLQTLDSELDSNDPKINSIKLGQRVEKIEKDVIFVMENKSTVERYFSFIFLHLLPCICFYGFIMIYFYLSFFE